MYPTLIQSDNEELQKRVRQFLEARIGDGLEDVEVNADNGVVTISGRYASPQARQVCLDCCRHVAGVLRIVDSLEQTRIREVQGWQEQVVPDGVSGKHDPDYPNGKTATAPRLRASSQQTASFNPFLQ